MGALAEVEEARQSRGIESSDSIVSASSRRDNFGEPSTSTSCQWPRYSVPTLYASDGNPTTSFCDAKSLLAEIPVKVFVLASVPFG
jgi:hypothetical protein